MPKIEAETATGVIAFEATQGRKLTLALKDAGIDILHRCGGYAKCTTCRVDVYTGDLGEIGELERNRLARETDLGEKVRLSCQVHITGDMKIRVVNQASIRGLDSGPTPAE